MEAVNFCHGLTQQPAKHHVATHTLPPLSGIGKRIEEKSKTHGLR